LFPRETGGKLNVKEGNGMPDVSASSAAKASSVDEMRMRNYRAQTEARHQAEMREIEEHDQDEITRLQSSHKDQMDQIKNAYELEISKEAEQLEERLSQVRGQNQERVVAERKTGDEEVAKVRLANQQKIAEYQKNSDTQLAQLRKETQASADALHEKARKIAKQDKEIQGA
jgi:hypothetical protein